MWIAIASLIVWSLRVFAGKELKGWTVRLLGKPSNTLEVVEISVPSVSDQCLSEVGIHVAAKSRQYVTCWFRWNLIVDHHRVVQVERARISRSKAFLFSDVSVHLI